MGRIERQRIVIPYDPRPQFLPFHNRTQRFAAGVAHRRAGKTVACINELIKGALTCKLQRPRFAYIAPLHKQAKTVAWDYLKHYALVIPGTTANESELRVDFPSGGQVRLYGGDNPDALRGIYLDGVVLDEFAQMRPQLWSEIIRPALADRQGWATFIGTPMGRNAFCELYENAKTDPDWFTFMLKASETRLILPSELEAARKAMTNDQYDQEFECSFQAAIMGSYYGSIMQQLDDDGHITRVPHEPAKPVETWWDLGVGDSTAIWFVQRVNAEIRAIDYYEMTGEGLPHYIKVLREKPYIYSRHIAPHDIEVRELGSGKSRRETAASLGLEFEVAPNLPVDDGIGAVRLMLRKMWFDAEKCARGIEALRQYRKDYDEKLKVFRDKPLHDWCSHPSDAARYGAVADAPANDWSTPIPHKLRGII